MARKISWKGRFYGGEDFMEWKILWRRRFHGVEDFMARKILWRGRFHGRADFMAGKISWSGRFYRGEDFIKEQKFYRKSFYRREKPENSSRDKISILQDTIEEKQMKDSRQPLQFKENPYQYTRGIRFRLKPVREGERFSKKMAGISSPDQGGLHLPDLAESLLEFHRGLAELLFCKPGKQHKNSSIPIRFESSGSYRREKTAKLKQDPYKKEDQKKMSDVVSVKKAWLREFHKDLFYLEVGKKQDGKYKAKKYKLSELKSIGDELKKRLEEWERYSCELKKVSQQPRESQFRHSDIAEYIRILSGRDHLIYMERLLEESLYSDPGSDEKVDSLKKRLSSLKEELKSAQEFYFSSQSSGVEVARASFNYYTVNKKPKDYYENKLSRIKKQLYGSCLKSQGLAGEKEQENPESQSESKSVPYLAGEKEQENTESQSESKSVPYLTEEKEQENPESQSESKSVPCLTGEKEQENLKLQSENKSVPCLTEKKEQKNLKLQSESKSVPCLTEEKKQENAERGFSIITKQGKCFKWQYEQRKRDTKKKKDNNTQIFSFASDQEKDWIKQYCEKHKLNNRKKDGVLSLSLDETYKAMKAFKAEQKSLFYEWFNRNVKWKETDHKNFKKQNENHGLLFGYAMDQKNHKFDNKEHKDCIGFEEINKMFSLFKFEYRNGKTAKEHYNKFVELSRKIVELSRKIQTEKNKKKRTEYKKAKGEFLFGDHCYFQGYGNFCKEYRRIAQQRGRFIAQIKGLEKEKREAVQTDHWALIYCDGDKKQLWLVPKEKMQKAGYFIYKKNNEKGDSLESSQHLCCFESLTMRALHKLCFSEQSSFVADMPEELKSLQKKTKEMKTDGNDDKLIKKNEKKMEFFKKLLSSDYAKKGLYYAKKGLWLKNFDLQKAMQASDLKTFEKELETACYYIKKVNFPAEKKVNFINTHDISVWDISSYDLEGRNKNTYQTPASENRYHTDLWQAFWDNIDNSNKKDTKVKGFRVGELRLNPEVRVYYRKTDCNLEEYFKQRNFPSEFNHRRKKDQRTVHFTLSLNAGEKYEDLAFAKPEELLQKIDDFNSKLNREMDFKTAWKYGIDRGKNELATLCLVKFDPQKDVYQSNGKTCLRPSFPSKGDEGIECLTLADHNHSEEYIIKTGETKKRWAIKNPSYFLDNKDLFIEESVSSLDLTTAKLIRGKIITNGDVMTYLRLKKESAKRQIFELHSKGQIPQEAKLEWRSYIDGKENKKTSEKNGALNIKTSDGEKTIYWYISKHENVPLCEGQKYNRQNIENNLNCYINKLRAGDSKHTLTVSQINHLRDAITANMVGVICYMQKHYKGFIIMEDLKKSNIDKRFSQSNENISRRLENALYNKFQSIGLVPPHIKNIIQLRERVREGQKHSQPEQKQKQSQQIKSSQIGAIVFVDEEETSKKCPYCEEKQSKEKSQSREKNKNQDREKSQRREKIRAGGKSQSKERGSQADEKYRQKRFICTNTSCGFDTYHFTPEEERVEDYTPPVDNSIDKEKFSFLKDINDPDKVAAYNIAKKITDPEKIGKMNQSS